MAGDVRIDKAVTSGKFTLDGGSWDVDNNVWVLGDDDECVVFDAPHDVKAILDVVGDRKLLAIICTHAHDDHIDVALDLAHEAGAPVWLNAADLELWRQTHGDDVPDLAVTDGMKTRVAGVDLDAIATPGHTPGGTCWYAPTLGVLFSGDTLFNGGPGATGRSFSNREVLEQSIRDRLFTLPEETVVHTGHGDDTTIGAEKAASADW